MADKSMGPIQVLAVGFNSPNFEGKIMDELKKLRDKNLIKLVDGIAVQKDKSGHISVIEGTDLSLGEAKRYGATIGTLIGIGSGDEYIAEQAGRAMAERFQEHYEYGLDKEDVEDIAENIPEGGAAIILMIEHLWAIPLRDAMRDSGGMLLAQDFLSPELLISMGKETLV